MLLRSKAEYINSNILHLTYTLVGTVNSEHESSCIPNAVAFQDLRRCECVCVCVCVFVCVCSLVPKPSTPPVFDRLQYANTEGEDLSHDPRHIFAYCKRSIFMRVCVCVCVCIHCTQ